MTARRQRMLEDRYLRDSARALVDADIKHLKSNFANKSLGERALDRVREGASDLYEEAIDAAEDNKGALAALVAAVVVWFARNPILQLFGFQPEVDEDEEDDVYDEPSEHSPSSGR